MDKSKLIRSAENEWRIEPVGSMRVPAILFSDENLIEAMDNKVFEQISNVASLPGIVQAAYAMPDAHWGYGFPIGGVAAFDPNEGGVISAGGVGFDISCGVRTMVTGLKRKDIEPIKSRWADILFQAIPSGVGSGSKIQLTQSEIDQMLLGGAQWALNQGYGWEEDLAHIEDAGCMKGAIPDYVSEKAKLRQTTEMGSLGSGNHYLEVQWVSEIYDNEVAKAFGLEIDDILISVHCGSRGLGHQIGTDYLAEMVAKATQYGLDLPEKELACAPIQSDLGQRYLGAMRSGINCALANRQIITHLIREASAKIFSIEGFHLLYDVSHNTCKEEKHIVSGDVGNSGNNVKIEGDDGEVKSNASSDSNSSKNDEKGRTLFVHRKGATHSLGPGHPSIPLIYRKVGQPVLIGGSMGTSSYILVGANTSARAFNSSCHGSGRSLSRHQAAKKWSGKKIVNELALQGIIIKSGSYREIAEEAPLAYKDVDEVVEVAENSGLSRKVAKLKPLICVKG